MTAPVLKYYSFILVIILFCIVDSQQARAKSVLIVHSSDIPEYTRPAEVIQDNYYNDVTAISFNPNVTTKDLLDKIITESPLTIFAFGTKAAYLSDIASRHLPQTKILLAQLPLKHLQKLATKNNNIAGISLELDPSTQLLNLMTILPKVQRVGLIYSNSNSLTFKQKAEDISSSIGFNLISAPIDHANQFKRTFKKLAEHIDSFLITYDHLFYNADNLSWLIAKCKKDNIRLFGQSDQLAEVGAMLTVNTDFNYLGYQLLSMAKGIQLPRMQGLKLKHVQTPISTYISMNIKTASLFDIGPHHTNGILIDNYISSQ